MELEISDQDIELTEKLLLPKGAHFSKEARKIICCWQSTDVVACPGSGKTTVLLAKLELLADKMLLKSSRGICVLSHTNVAVNEIREKLSDNKNKLFSYPNYIGTIQSFIDKFVTMPYLRNIVGRNVQVVDSRTYAQHMLIRLQNKQKYQALNYVANNSLKKSKLFTTRIDYVQALHIRDDGALCIGKQKRALAGADKIATKQYLALKEELLENEGIIQYQDAYVYAEEAVRNLSKEYTDLFSYRFQYVFIDEYQDCSNIQRLAIDEIFDSKKCTVIKFGDPDQAIYNSSGIETLDWEPRDNSLALTLSCRYSQEIANVICKLKKWDKCINTSVGDSGNKPVLIIFNSEGIKKVIGCFIQVLENRGLYDEKGVYKVIGAVKKEETSGLKIGSYWSGFDSSVERVNEYSYWSLIDEIVASLLEGKLYKSEGAVRKLICRILHYSKIKNPVSGKEYSSTTIKRFLDDEYREVYSQWIFELSKIQNIERGSVDSLMRNKIIEFMHYISWGGKNIFDELPDFFLEGNAVANGGEKNLFIDPIRGRRIVFNTIHGVKGETHDATLYLETDRKGASDLDRILPYYGIGKLRSSNLVDYSRKLAYVGMSRPKKLLCVAMQDKTFRKCESVFVDDWEIIDLREEGYL